MRSEEIVIKTHNLTKTFGNFTAVNAITFEVKAGEIFGFLGANGAGKTTAMRILCGLLSPTSGEATVAGFDVYKQNEEIKKRIGYMSQKFSLYETLTVRENIEFFGKLKKTYARVTLYLAWRTMLSLKTHFKLKFFHCTIIALIGKKIKGFQEKSGTGFLQGFERLDV